MAHTRQSGGFFATPLSKCQTHTRTSQKLSTSVREYRRVCEYTGCAKSLSHFSLEFQWGLFGTSFMACARRRDGAPRNKISGLHFTTIGFALMRGPCAITHVTSKQQRRYKSRRILSEIPVSCPRFRTDERTDRTIGVAKDNAGLHSSKQRERERVEKTFSDFLRD